MQWDDERHKTHIWCSRQTSQSGVARGFACGTPYVSNSQRLKLHISICWKHKCMWSIFHFQLEWYSKWLLHASVLVCVTLPPAMQTIFEPWTIIHRRHSFATIIITGYKENKKKRTFTFLLVADWAQKPWLSTVLYKAVILDLVQVPCSKGTSAS